MDDLRAASAAYFNDSQFSDFVILCDDRNYNVHRCFICAHSKWFERCCAGSFAEASERSVELKEDLPLAVDRMIEYLYKFEYNEDPGLEYEDTDDLLVTSGREPIFPLQLNAHMYGIADKYDISKLKTLALEKFKKSSVPVINSKVHLIGVVYTVYRWIQLRDDDTALKEALLDMWIVASSELKVTSADLIHLPEFAADLSVRLLKGFYYNNMSAHCSKCSKKFSVNRQSKVTNDAGEVTGKTPTTIIKCTACGGESEISSNVQVQSHYHLVKFW